MGPKVGVGAEGKQFVIELVSHGLHLAAQFTSRRCARGAAGAAVAGYGCACMVTTSDSTQHKHRIVQTAAYNA